MMDSNEVNRYDKKDEEEIYTRTNILQETLVSTGNIVIAAYAIGNSTPTFRNCNCCQFWEENVIPFITWTLNENVKLHAFIAQFLTAIRNLSIHIQESVKMVKMAKGSSGSISAAQQTISAALNVLEDLIKEASNSNSTDVVMATNKMRTLYAMIKSQETKYQGQKGDINVRILEYEQEHEEIASEMQSEKNKLTDLKKQIRNLEQLIQSTKDHLIQLKDSNSDLILKNQDTEKHIESIPEWREEIVIGPCNCFFWCHQEHHITKMVPNTREMAHRNEMKNKVEERKNKIQQNNANSTKQNEVLRILKQQLHTHKTNYTNINDELCKSPNKYQVKIQEIQRNINKLQKKNTELENEASHFQETIGSTVIDKLNEVAALNENLRKRDSVYSQIATILRGIKRPVPDSLALLTSGIDENAFHATKRLTKQASFLANYVVFAKNSLKRTPELSAITSTT